MTGRKPLFAVSLSPAGPPAVRPDDSFNYKFVIRHPGASVRNRRCAAGLFHGPPIDPDRAGDFPGKADLILT